MIYTKTWAFKCILFWFIFTASLDFLIWLVRLLETAAGGICFRFGIQYILEALTLLIIHLKFSIFQFPHSHSEKYEIAYYKQGYSPGVIFPGRVPISPGVPVQSVPICTISVIFWPFPWRGLARLTHGTKARVQFLVKKVW